MSNSKEEPIILKRKEVAAQKLKKYGHLLTIVLVVWLSIHVLALVGVIFALLYLLFWSLKHSNTPCFYPFIFRNKKDCLWCNVHIEPKLPHWPLEKKSALKNCLFIILCTLVSFISVGIELLIFGWIQPKFQISINSKQEVAFSGNVDVGGPQYYIGEIIPMPIELVNIQNPINAVQTDLGFDTNSFELVDFDTGGSFATIFIQKQIDNKKGYARLVGGLPNPGFSGEKGLFALALLKTKKAGELSVFFLPSSLVLANDGKATNLLEEGYKLTFQVKNEQIPKDKLLEQESMYLKRSGLSANTEYSDKQLQYYEGTVLGASTSKELENLSKRAVKSDSKQVLYLYDRMIVRLWLGWLVKI